jgi:hypothetical protein
MFGQTAIRIIGLIFWILAIIIIMATYGVLAKPLLETELSKGLFGKESFYNISIVLSVLFLTVGTFLITYPFKKK